MIKRIGLFAFVLLSPGLAASALSDRDARPALMLAAPPDITQFVIPETVTFFDHSPVVSAGPLDIPDTGQDATPASKAAPRLTWNHLEIVQPKIRQIAFQVPELQHLPRVQGEHFELFSLAPGQSADWQSATKPDLEPRGAAFCDALKTYPLTGEENLPFDPATVFADILDSGFCAENSGRPQDRFRFPDKL